MKLHRLFLLSELFIFALRSPSSIAKMARNGPCNVQIQIQMLDLKCFLILRPVLRCLNIKYGKQKAEGEVFVNVRSAVGPYIVDNRFLLKSEARMTASVLKQDPNTYKRLKRTLICYDTDKQFANFRGNPLCQATKRHLNNS